MIKNESEKKFKMDEFKKLIIYSNIAEFLIKDKICSDPFNIIQGKNNCSKKYIKK